LGYSSTYIPIISPEVESDITVAQITYHVFELLFSRGPTLVATKASFDAKVFPPEVIKHDLFSNV
jgi:hypothetical protein